MVINTWADSLRARISRLIGRLAYIYSDLLTPRPCRHARQFQFGVAIDFS